MVRPREIGDNQLLEATAIVIGRSGPSFALADVAEQAGVSVGTVAGRFGSKNALLQELNRSTTRHVLARMRAVAAGAADPLSGLRAALLIVFEDLGDAHTAANHLGQLGVDIGDARLRALLGEHFAAVEGEIRQLVRTAHARLPGAPRPERAARTLLAVLNGDSIDWSIRPKGRLADRLGQDIDAVLQGWRRKLEE